jgi:hypothetical protein
MFLPPHSWFVLGNVMMAQREHMTCQQYSSGSPPCWIDLSICLTNATPSRPQYSILTAIASNLLLVALVPHTRGSIDNHTRFFGYVCMNGLGIVVG